jgi:UDPglucose--hexose-1-phosphate uridylyltransferase
MHRVESVFDDTLPAITGGAPGTSTHRCGRLLAAGGGVTNRHAVGKLKYLAGSESAMGAVVNDISPGAAARRLPDIAHGPAATPSRGAAAADLTAVIR